MAISVLKTLLLACRRSLAESSLHHLPDSSEWSSTRWSPHWSSARRSRSFTEERIDVAPEFRLFRKREMASRSGAGAQRGTVAVVQGGMRGPEGSGDLHQRANVVATKPSSRREWIILHKVEDSRHEVRWAPGVEQPNQYILSSQLALLSIIYPGQVGTLRANGPRRAYLMVAARYLVHAATPDGCVALRH